MILLLQYTIVFAVVLTVVALAGMWSERSGVINIGLEGTMVIGALSGALAMHYLPLSIPGGLYVILVMLIAIVAGIIYSLLLALAAVTFKANQTITGTAMNILASALAIVVVKAITLNESGKASVKIEFIEARNFFIVQWGEFEFNWFMLVMVLILIISMIVLYRTKFGLNLMSCGENPQAADSNGIKVKKMRYIGVMISGALAGIGGLAYIMGANSSWSFDAGVSGFGFLALAVMILGQWKPFLIFLGAILFGVLRALNLTYTSFGWMSIDPTFYLVLPYVVCLVVLCFTSRKSKAPKAEGIPYDKGLR